MNDIPRVSVIIPTFNRSHFIKNCILSVKLQSLKPVEIIVVDDGSSDDTFSLLMNMGLSYDSKGGRAICGAITALMTGTSYKTSAKLAREVGSFKRFTKNKKPLTITGKRFFQIIYAYLSFISKKIILIPKVLP